ncbi:hypothetical protein LX32DRAFT_25783 [Colletotrichum zoysiae]|uniref:Uncharacterized protein n=1 Tax=Colletotrichum zoysiae TaxID=1216348 RepID=A0AAD9HRL7_9PEZI|nr:hypothetical protein LX32DRAFT_25783 [Colletotrichum zoysiae]
MIQEHSLNYGHPHMHCFSPLRPRFLTVSPSFSILSLSLSLSHANPLSISRHQNREDSKPNRLFSVTHLRPAPVRNRDAHTRVHLPSIKGKRKKEGQRKKKRKSQWKSGPLDSADEGPRKQRFNLRQGSGGEKLYSPLSLPQIVPGCAQRHDDAAACLSMIAACCCCRCRCRRPPSTPFLVFCYPAPRPRPEILLMNIIALNPHKRSSAVHPVNVMSQYVKPNTRHLWPVPYLNILMQ